VIRFFDMLRRLCFLLVICACGARTELYAFESDAAPSRDASPDVRDASALDVTDAPVIEDVTSGCDGGVTAYLWDFGGVLYTFDPTTLATSPIGQVSCPTNASPWTFTVSRAGYALMIYEDWKIYRVDLSTLACAPTPFMQSDIGFNGNEAIAISRDPNTPERLYIYGVSNSGPTLAVADPVALVPTPVGPVNAKPQLFPADMQGDALGHLFVLGEQGHFLELDSKSAAVLVDVQTSFSAGDWAVMTYGNQVFFFGDGDVSLEDVASDTLTPLGSTGVSVVGASAAPCTE
jgi:hypothetical protein